MNLWRSTSLLAKMAKIQDGRQQTEKNIYVTNDP